MKRLFLLTIFFFILTSASAQRVFLISVGYNGSNLRYAEKDAKDVCRVFKKRTADSLRYELCTGSDATVSHVTAALSKCERIARPEDTFVFFFSGHCGMKFYDGSFTYSQLYQHVKDINASNKAIIINTCYSGNAKNQDWNVDLEPGDNIMILTSCRSGETSAEYENLDNGAFPTWLVPGLAGRADKAPRDKVVTAIELYTYVNAGLEKLSERTGREQHPTMRIHNQQMPIIKLR